jgi:hypothetical protein
MICPNCGYNNEENARFCSNCGTPLATTQDENTKEDGPQSEIISEDASQYDDVSPEQDPAGNPELQQDDETTDTATGDEADAQDGADAQPEAESTPTVETAGGIHTIAPDTDTQTADTPMAEVAAADNTSEKVPKKKKHTKAIVGIVVAVVVVVAVVAALVITNINATNEYNAYIDNLNSAQSKMLEGAADSEELINLTRNVWYNAIWGESDSGTDKYTNGAEDFNEALNNLYSDEEIQQKVSDILANQAEVDDIMKELQDPPEGLETCYSTVTDLYSEYYNMVTLATSPTGSLSTYSADTSTADSNFMIEYNKLTSQIPEKK